MGVIDIKQVEYVAKLARLKLTPEELKRFSSQLDAILGYIAKLNEVDTETTLPTSHAIPVKNVFRKDEIKPSLSQDEVLKNAPSSKDGFFVVPKIIEEE